MTVIGATLIFLAIFVSDVFWVKCVRSVNEENPLMSGLWAIGIFLPTALTTVAYVYNPWLLIPACAGHFCGTAATVWWKKYRKEVTLEKLLSQYDWSRHKQSEWW